MAYRSQDCLIMSNAALFLDRDGVINECSDMRYISYPSDFLPYKDIEALGAVNMPIFIVTNQAGVVGGYTTLNNLSDITKITFWFLQYLDIPIRAIVAALAPSGSDDYFRKPNTGMIDMLCQAYNIDREKSFFVGDSYTDIMAGNAAGMKTIMLNRHNHEFSIKGEPLATHVCKNMLHVVDIIMQ